MLTQWVGRMKYLPISLHDCFRTAGCDKQKSALLNRDKLPKSCVLSPYQLPTQFGRGPRWDAQLRPNSWQYASLP